MIKVHLLLLLLSWYIYLMHLIYFGRWFIQLYPNLHHAYILFMFYNRLSDSSNLHTSFFHLIHVIYL